MYWHTTHLAETTTAPPSCSVHTGEHMTFSLSFPKHFLVWRNICSRRNFPSFQQTSSFSLLCTDTQYVLYTNPSWEFPSACQLCFPVVWELFPATRSSFHHLFPSSVFSHFLLLISKVILQTSIWCPQLCLLQISLLYKMEFTCVHLPAASYIPLCSSLLLKFNTTFSILSLKALLPSASSSPLLPSLTCLLNSLSPCRHSVLLHPAYSRIPLLLLHNRPVWSTCVHCAV